MLTGRSLRQVSNNLLRSWPIFEDTVALHRRRPHEERDSTIVNVAIPHCSRTADQPSVSYPSDEYAPRRKIEVSLSCHFGGGRSRVLTPAPSQISLHLRLKLRDSLRASRGDAREHEKRRNPPHQPVADNDELAKWAVHTVGSGILNLDAVDYRDRNWGKAAPRVSGVRQNKVRPSSRSRR